MPVVSTFDAILDSRSCNGAGVTGRPTFVTYSFDTKASDSFVGVLPDAFLDSFQPLTAAEQDIARQALKAWADVCGLTLFEVPPGQGDIRFGVYDFRLGPPRAEDALGFAFGPAVYNDPESAREYDYGGDIFLNLGCATFDTIVHEIGHALGLKHPFDGSPTLDPAIDNAAHTVMTYNPAGRPATALGTLDVQAIQHLYGPQSADGTEAASWSWDAKGFVLTQAGGAGNDTLAGVAVADRIRAGAGNDYVMSRGGTDVLDGEDGADTMAGGDGEDTLTGGAGNDVLGGDDGSDSLTGEEGDDKLWGFDGPDTLDGGAGNDKLFGGPGANRLFGGAGDDGILVDDGSSFIDGGEGADNLILAPLNPVSVVLSYSSLTAGGGSYTNIETISMFGGIYSDTLQGGALEDYLFGRAGARPTGSSGRRAPIRSRAARAMTTWTDRPATTCSSRARVRIRSTAGSETIRSTTPASCSPSTSPSTPGATCS